MSAPTVPGHTADDNQAWLTQVPLETLECRTLRHQWPRMARDKRGRHKLPASGPVVWRSLGAGEAGRLVEREMTCLAGCGTVRIELFLVRRDGRMIRDGHPRYRYGTQYLRRRADPDEPPLAPLDQEDILGALVHRLYPQLRW